MVSFAEESPFDRGGEEEDEDELELLRQINLRAMQGERGARFASSSQLRLDHATEPVFTLRELKAMKQLFDETPSQGMSMEQFVNYIGPSIIRLSASATNKDVELLFKRIDANANGCVDWDEFAAFLLMNDVKATLKLTAEAKSKEFALAPTTREAQTMAHHALRHVMHKEAVRRVIVHPKHGKYFTSSPDGMVKVWNADTLRHIQTVQANPSASVTDMALTQWNDSIAVTAMDNTISFYSCDTGDLLRCYQGERLGRVSGRLRTGELLFDNRHTVVRRPHFAIPVNRHEGENIKYGSASQYFGKVETTVPVLEHFVKPQSIPAIALTNFGVGYEGKQRTMVTAGYPSAIDVCNIRGEPTMLVGFDNGYMQLYNVNGGPQNPATATLTGAPDMVSEKPRNTIRMHWDYVSRLIAVPQMDIVLSCSYDGMIQVRTFDRIEDVNTLLGEGAVSNLGAKSMMLGGPSSAMQDTAAHGHAHRITYMDWNYECRLIASCAPEKDVLIWSPYIHKPVTRLVHPKGIVRHVQFMKESDQILTMGSDRTVRLWDVRTYRCIQALQDHDEREDVQCASYDHKRECVVLGSTCLRTWGLVQTTEYHRRYSGHRRPVIALAISLAFRQVITADHRMIVVWEMDTQLPIMRWEVEGNIADISLDSNGRRLLVALLNGPIHVYNYVNGLLLKVCNPGGCKALRAHHEEAQRKKQALAAKSAVGATDAGVRPESSKNAATNSEPEVASVRFANVTRPRPSSIILTTTDDGLTGVFLDEEGGGNAPHRTLQVATASLASHVDTSYNTLLMGQHNRISSCGLEETTSSVNTFSLLSADDAKRCKVALFVGALTEEPVPATRRYLANRDTILEQGNINAIAPHAPRQKPAVDGKVTPMKREKTNQQLLSSSTFLQRSGGGSNKGSSLETSASLLPPPAPSLFPGMHKLRTLVRLQTSAMSASHRLGSMFESGASALSAPPSGAGASSPTSTLPDFGADIERRQLQSLGLIAAICVMSSVDPHVVVTGSSDGLIQLWDERAQRELLRFRATPLVDAVTSLALTHDEDALLVGDNNGYVSIFDMSGVVEESAMRAMELSYACSGPGSAPLPPPSLRDDMVQLRVRFRAHTEAVTSLGLDEGVIPLATARNTNALRRQSQSTTYATTTSEAARIMEDGPDQLAFAGLNAKDVDDIIAAMKRKEEARAVGRRKSFFHDDLENSGNDASRGERSATEASNVKAYVVTAESDHVKLFTSSIDTHVYVWLMHRRSCTMQLAACLGDPVFVPVPPPHHRQVLEVYDLVRCRLIERYMQAEGKCTWPMLVAHYARAVEKRRVSLFSAADTKTKVAIPYIDQSFDAPSPTAEDSDARLTADGSGALLKTESSGVVILDIEDASDDDYEDDSENSSTPANASQFNFSVTDVSGSNARDVPRELPKFSILEPGALGGGRNRSGKSSNVASLGKHGGFTGMQSYDDPGPAKMTGKRLLRDQAYLADCSRAFDPTTHDDKDLESLLRRLVSKMVYAGEPATKTSAETFGEAMAFVDEKGFYCPTRPVAPVGGDASRHHVATVVLSSEPSAAVLSKSLGRQTTKKLDTPSRSDTADRTLRSEEDVLPGSVVEVWRPPRHLVELADTSHLRDPPNDIRDVLASADIPRTVLVGDARLFTGVRSAQREIPKHPYVSRTLLDARGELPFVPEEPKPASQATLEPASCSSALTPRETICTPATEPLSMRTPDGPSLDVLTASATACRRERHDFMRSVMSFSSDTSTVAGGGPGTPRTARRPTTRGGLALLYSDVDHFAMPPLSEPYGDGGSLEVSLRTGGRDIPRLRSAEEGGSMLPPLLPQDQGTPCTATHRGQLVRSTSGSSIVIKSLSPTALCRLQADMLDDLLRDAKEQRDEAIAQSRRYHNSAPSSVVWDASDMQQRRMRRGGDGAIGGCVLVQGEDQQNKMRQARTAIDLRHRFNHVGRRPKVATTGDDDKNRDDRAIEHLNHFRSRAANVVGEDSVGGPLASPRGNASVNAGAVASAKRPPKTSDGDDGVLGSLQWVSRLHSKLDVPRTFELVPTPPTLEKAREVVRATEMRESDLDHGWIRMLSTARGKKAANKVRERRSPLRIRSQSARAASTSAKDGKEATLSPKKKTTNSPKKGTQPPARSSPSRSP